MVEAGMPGVIFDRVPRLVPGKARDAFHQCGKFVVFIGASDALCAAQGFKIIPGPPVPESLFSQPAGHFVEAEPLPTRTTGVENPYQLGINIHCNCPGKWMAVLVTVTSALVSQGYAVDDGIISQSAGLPDRREIRLGH